MSRLARLAEGVGFALSVRIRGVGGEVHLRLDATSFITGAHRPSGLKRDPEIAALDSHDLTLKSNPCQPGERKEVNWAAL
jgi:hypothetical protein